MISIITYGRNDNYGFNLAKRTSMSFNSLAEILTEEDEIFFVDYNTPGHLPTLPEDIWDTFTEKARRVIKVIRVSPEIHKQVRKDSPLPILENVSRNAAIRRSNPANHWMLSTNPDVLLVLAERWKNLSELLSTLKDSFYELPRFDIPESVWGSLSRFDPKSNLSALRDWLVANRAAIAETVPDHRFQKYYLFDAPGDFQLAPREFFFLCRGFDESMNMYFHSDSNLAKRMWMLNGEKTDHLLDDIWVLHQDHYLSGEWTSRVGSIKHNDYVLKVERQDQIEANNESDWGLPNADLPMFTLADQMRQRRQVAFVKLPDSNGDLKLSREIDWKMQPVYRLHHYDPDVITLYLREILQVISPSSQLVYLGQNQQTLQQIRRIWSAIAPSAPEVIDAASWHADFMGITPDVLLTDFYYQRSEASEKSIQMAEERIHEQYAKKRISESQAFEEMARFADNADSVNLERALLPLWHRTVRHMKFRPGAYIILMGCNSYVNVYAKFQEVIAFQTGALTDAALLPRLHAFYQGLKYRFGSLTEEGLEVPRKDLPSVLKAILAVRMVKRRVCKKLIGHNSFMGLLYFNYIQRRIKELLRKSNLENLYIHHRLVIMRVKSTEAPASAAVASRKTAA